MRRLSLQTLVVVCLVVFAGCATTGQTTTTASPTATTQAATATTTATTTAPATTQPTTVPRAERVPFVLENEAHSSKSVYLVISNESTVVYNDTVDLDAGAKRHVATLTGQENTYDVTATMNGSSFERPVTLNAGLLQSGITINESEEFEYSYVIN